MDRGPPSLTHPQFKQGREEKVRDREKRKEGKRSERRGRKRKKKNK